MKNMISGQDMLQKQRTIEAIMDEIGLANIVQILASVCCDKAAHIFENWQDDSLAKVWEEHSKTLETLAERIIDDKI